VSAAERLAKHLHVATPLAFAAGILCALEPIQLLYERYVMAEAVSLFVFALYLVAIFRYLQQPRLTMLSLVQLLGVTAVSLRLSFLPVVLVNAGGLPLLAAWQPARVEAPSRPALRPRNLP